VNNIKIILLIVFVLASCQSNINNNINDNDDEKILWKSSDEYPSVRLCNDLKATDLIKECFQTFLSNQIFDKLKLNQILIDKPINDTVYISLLIDNRGEISITDKNIPKSTINIIPNFESIITNIIDSLPNVLPATKTNLGVSVRSKFKLPIIIKSK
tara:strand:- start:130 stop:600 length:471 start_codon:yes stop_codon:yes gene_type:complete